MARPKLTVAEAQAGYRAAWQQYCLTKCTRTKRMLEQTMDAYQVYCTSTGAPGPEWEAFIDTLPGYREHWEELAQACRQMIADQFPGADG